MTLKDDSEEKWIYTEHAKVKHEILSKYITSWSKILGKFYNLNIFDCFAGRGKYANGEEGSPLKIIKILINLRKKTGKPRKAKFFFIEANKKNFKMLESEVKGYVREDLDWLDINIFQGEFSDTISTILENHSSDISPGFFFIDPFGFGGIPLKKIEKLLSYERTEVFITFMIRDVIRFLESPTHQKSIKDLFGYENILKRINEKPYDNLIKEKALLKLYRNQLHTQAKVKYTLPFKVNSDNKIQTTYYLIHCTNHPKGCALMKDIMYNSGTPGRYGYLGPVEGQLSLDFYFEVDKLKPYLLNKFKNRKLTFAEVKHESLMDTYYITKHFRKAIKELFNEKKINLEKQGSRGGIKDKTIIDFKKKYLDITQDWN